MRLALVGLACLVAASCGGGGQSPFVERGNEICGTLEARSDALGLSPLMAARELTPEVAEAAREWATQQQRLFAQALENLRLLEPPDDLAAQRDRLFDAVDALGAVGARASLALDESLAAQQRGDARAEAAANRRLEAANLEARRHATRGRGIARDLGLTACVDALFAG